MGYVIQDGGLFPHLTAAGNVTLMAGELRWEGGRIRKRLAELAGIILRKCPGVQILATSREGLNILGETTYPLAPLSVPDPRQILSDVETLGQYEAIKLFV